MTAHTRHSAPIVDTGEQEPSGAGHRRGNRTHRAATPMNGNHVANDSAHSTQRTERAHQ